MNKLSESLLRRKPKSDVANAFIGVAKRDKDGKPTVLTVPASKGTLNRVILRRKNGFISGECHKMLGSLGFKPCLGNVNTICYHVRAAIDFAINESGRKGSWCGTEADALEVAKFHKDKKWFIVPAKSHSKKVTTAFVVASESR